MKPRRCLRNFLSELYWALVPWVWVLAPAGAALSLVGNTWSQEFILRHVQLTPALAETQLRKHPEWIRVSRSELEKLLKAVQSRNQSQSRLPVVVLAHYQARWDDGALIGKAQWQVWAWDERPVQLSCQPFSLAVRQPVRVNGQQADAGVWSSGEFGIALPGLSCPTNPPTPARSTGVEYKIEFDWSVSLERRGNEQVASLQIPPALLTTLDLEVPANFRVSMRGVEASLFKKAPTGEKRNRVSYQWALDPGTTRFEWVLSSSMGETASQCLYVNQQAQHTLDSSGWQSSYLVSLESTAASLSTVKLYLPAGTQVQSLQERLHGLDAGKWTQETQQQVTILTVHLQGGERRAELEIVCRARPLRWDSPVEFPLALVDGATSQVNTLTIRWRQELALSGWAFGDFQPRQPPQPSRDGFWQLTLEQTALGLVGIAGLPRATVRRQTAEVSVQAEFHCQLGIRESRMLAKLAWNVRSGAVFRLGVRLPANWIVEDGEVSPGKDAPKWIWRRQGDRLWAELQSGTLQAPATVHMNLRLRSSKQEPDFSRSGDWPLPEIVPEQANWAQATWYLILERLRDEQGRSFPPGVLWPGQPWMLRPSSVKESAQGAADYGFVGPLPSGARLRVQPLPSLKQVTLETHLDLASGEGAVAPGPVPRSLHVRWSVKIDPVSGLVDSLRIRFPGKAPELDWKIVAGESRIRRSQRRLVPAEGNATQENWTLFEWTFDQPLTMPTRLEADWLYPWPAKKQADGHANSASACFVPLPSGEDSFWWSGRISCGSNVPPEWEWLLETFASAGQAKVIPLTALPHSYTEPAQLQVRTRPFAVSPIVLEGALLGITWNGQDELECNYWAWTRPLNWASNASSSQRPSLRLRLPRGATLRAANVWRVVNELALPTGQVQPDDSAQHIMFTPPEQGPVVFHVRYTQPVRTTLCLARWPEVAPVWDSPATVLGQRIWVCLPETWVPLARNGKTLCGNNFSQWASRALQTEVASPVRSAIISWVGQGTTDATNLSRVEMNGFFFKLVYSGFTWWELSDIASWTGKVWIRSDQAHVFAASTALVIGVLVGALLRWTPRIGFAAMIAVLLFSWLGLIWLPKDLAILSFWPLSALGLLLCFWICVQTRTNYPASRKSEGTAWFSASRVAHYVGWLAVALSLAFGSVKSQSALADELAAQASAKPSSAPQAKELPVVTVFHYVEGQGDQERHWVLVPLEWWQRWQDIAHEPQPSRSWVITTSRWEVDASHTEVLDASLTSATASVQWELEVTLFSQEATIPLHVAGIRWQSAIELTGADARPADLTPLDKGNGLLLRLSGVGKHRLRLVGQVNIRSSDQSLQISWRIPPIPVAELRARLPASARYSECPGSRGRFKQSLVTKPTTSDKPVWECHTELGPISELRLSWHLADGTSPQWRVEEFHWLRVEKHEVLWSTICRLEVPRGQASELRINITEAHLVRSVEARDTSGTILAISSWQVRSGTHGKELVIQFARPISTTCLVHVEYVVDTRAGSAWLVWQKTHAAVNALCPRGSTPAIMFWWQPAEELERLYVRRLTLLLPVPTVLGQGARAGAWLVWQADANTAVRITPRIGLKPILPASELANHWPTNWLPLPEVKPSDKPSPPRLFQVLTPAARLLVEIGAASSDWTVKRTLVLEADWYQARMSLSAELYSRLGSLPSTLVAQLPAGWRITEIIGEQVSEWQQEGNQLRIWLRAGLQRTTLQVEGITSISGSADRRTFHLPAVHFPAFRAVPGTVELSAVSGLRLQVVKSQGLTLSKQSENKVSYEAPGPTYAGIVELQAAAPRVTAQLTSTLRLEPYWWWETQVECRSSTGIMRNLVVYVQHWSGSPPWVISEELHHAQVDALPEGEGYRVRLEFPDAASLSDQTVRFRIAGRLRADDSPVPAPVIHLPEAQAIRHRLTAWPKGLRVENATKDGEAWPLPTDPNAKPALLHLTSTQSSSVRLAFAQVDTWRHGPHSAIVQLTCWLAHPTHTWLTVHLPPASTLLHVMLDSQSIPWQMEGEEVVRLPLVASTGFSRLCLVWQCSRIDVQRPLPRLAGQTIEAAWLQHWLPLHEAALGEDLHVAQEQQLAQARSLVSWLGDELRAADSQDAAALVHLARPLSELLQAGAGDVPPQIFSGWQELQRQWSQLTASPRFDPLRRALSQQASSPKSLSLTVPLPFLAAQARGLLWSNTKPWPADPPTEAWWRNYAIAGTATAVLLAGACAFLAATMFPLGRRWIGRFAPESLLGLAGFWVLFLEPRWAAGLLVLLGLYWRLRRWRAARSLLYSQDFTLNST